MFEKELNAGFLFNQFPKDILHSLRLCTSDADMLLKLAQHQNPSVNLSHGHQIFRNLRAGKELENTMDKYLKRFFDDEYVDFSSYKGPGGQSILRSFVTGFRSTLLKDELGHLKLCDFLIAHCNLEVEVCLKAFETKEVSIAENFLKEFILLEEINFETFQANSWNTRSREFLPIVNYIIQRVLYWAALFELFLKIEYPDKLSSVFKHCTPTYTIEGDTIKFSLSSEKFLERIKGKFAQKSEKNKISWAAFYREIKRRQLTDPSLQVKPYCVHSVELIDPDISSLKKQVQRWRDGKSRFSYSDIRRNFGVLFMEFDKTKFDLSLYSYCFINLFTTLQDELLRRGVPPQIIVDAFAKYQEIERLVEKRFDSFCQNGSLM